MQKSKATIFKTSQLIRIMKKEQPKTYKITSILKTSPPCKTVIHAALQS